MRKGNLGSCTPLDPSRKLRNHLNQPELAPEPLDEHLLFIGLHQAKPALNLNYQRHKTTDIHATGF